RLIAYYKPIYVKIYLFSWLLTMNQDKYWEIIETARRDARETAEIPNLIKDQLLKMTQEERDEFEDCYFNLSGKLDNDIICYIVREITGGLGNDGFMDFCGWLASLNRSIFDRVLADPNYLYQLREIILKDSGDMERLAAYSAIHQANREIEPKDVKIYEVGDLLTFQFSDGKFYGAIVADITTYKGEWQYAFCMLDYSDIEKPTEKDLRENDCRGNFTIHVLTREICDYNMSFDYMFHSYLTSIKDRIEKLGNFSLRENINTASVGTMENLEKLEECFHFYKDSFRWLPLTLFSQLLPLSLALKMAEELGFPPSQKGVIYQF
ncbi:MAG TPA: hypothetical protein DD000_08185, partial [Cyanobacteria bacterium UBA11166]|nr:hypothetical protein [Cyanobacteria bacterium UBA11166]